MANLDVRARIEGMFPRPEDVPAAAEFAAGGGVFPDGDLYLVDGELRRWTGESVEVTSPVCMARDGKTERRSLGRAASLTREAALEAMAAAVRAWDKIGRAHV